MRETERRIDEYQKRLPYLYTKVTSVALFLLISVIMMTSATFAWVTISKNPEIKGIETTLAANGNLEIALSKSDGGRPNESMVGDGQLDIALRNLTWGNLINLSHPSYGLDELVLRPASLNTSSLLNSPLFAAKYSEDGRIEDLTSEFAYTNYDTGKKMFMVPGTTQYGVRAISSVTYTFADGKEVFAERLQEADSKLRLAQSKYTELTNNSDNMTTISKIMGDYLTDKFGDSNTDFQQYVPQMYSMLKEFEACMEIAGEAIVRIANLQLMLKKGSEVSPYTLETLLSASSKELQDNGVSIEGLDTYKTDRSTFATHMATMEKLNTQVTQNGSAVYWTEHGLDKIVNFLVKVDTVVVDGMEVKSIGMSEAASMLVSGGDHKAIIMEGALFNMEKRLGTYMYAEDMPVTVTATVKGFPITQTLKADVYTDAFPTAYLEDEIKKVKNNNTGNFIGTDPVAADTYGMAIDFWVRTNAENDYLILEGNTLTTKVHKTDAQGNKYFTNQETEEVIIQAPDGKYYDTNGQEVSGDNLSITYEDVVIGYEGENRVWDDEVLTEHSTTQGGGSCYVFYADTPQDQAQSLEILNAMTVVFVDDTGKLLAYADLNTESFYAESGRVTVPLKLRSTSTKLGQDEAGNDIYAITDLNKGEAKRITALIYIDGDRVANTEVLSDGNIQGKLNLQFGSYVDLEAIKDDEVFDEEIHISGSATPNTFDVATQTDLTSEVKLTITGVKPTKVEANFIRQINSTQGSRQDTILFTPGANDTYTANVRFASPGDYVLRTVWLDGIEYKLDSPITVKVSGFAIAGVGWQHDNNYVKILRAESYYSEDITVQFGGTSKQPGKVQGIFSNAENQQITVNFKKGTTNWGGTAQFTTSGVYTMKYLLVDGEYYEVPSSMQKSIDLSLGMQVKVQVSETVLEKFTGNPPKTLEVYATILDNKGNQLTALENVSIQYLAQGSGLTENGLYSIMLWNEDEGRYKGNFEVKYAGAYQFAYLTFGSSSINSAEAPVITAIPPVPPSYHSNLTEENIFAFGSEVYMRVALADSVAIADGKTIAVLEKLDDDGNVVAEIRVPGTKAAHIEEGVTNVSDWLFTIPTTEELETQYNCTGVSQLGDWRMTELHIIGAYQDGVLSTEENPMIIDVSSKNIRTNIDDTMTVVVYGEGQETNETFLFLDTRTVTSGLSVKVQGKGGVTATGVKDVTVTYVLSDSDSDLETTNSTTSAGYYFDPKKSSKATLTSNLVSHGTVTVTLMENPSVANEFILNTDSGMELPLMGTYKLEEVTFKIGNTTYTANAGHNDEEDIHLNADAAPSYTLTWDAPIVKITGIYPEGTVKVNKGNGASPIEGTATNKFNEYECTVNLQADIKTNVGEGCDGEDKVELNGYTSSTVTTTISNIRQFTSASVFVGGSETDVTFNYTSATPSSTMSIGSSNWILAWNRQTMGNGAKGQYVTIDGTTSNMNITYIFKLDNEITINNPY
ncbi:MAG: hypothetical protein IJA54_05260 [Tyzzerella sp.]|nr:hypothetical protein [Tyzzerella sp.]